MAFFIIYTQKATPIMPDNPSENNKYPVYIKGIQNKSTYIINYTKFWYD